MVNNGLRLILISFCKELKLRRELNCRLDEAAKKLFDGFVQYLRKQKGMNVYEALAQFSSEELGLTDSYTRQVLRRKFIRFLRQKITTGENWKMLPLEHYSRCDDS